MSAPIGCRIIPFTPQGREIAEKMGERLEKAGAVKIGEIFSLPEEEAKKQALREAADVASEMAGDPVGPDVIIEFV